MERKKITIVGDAGCGKTCAFISYLNGKFSKEYLPTVVDNYATNIEISGETHTFDLFDTSGNEAYDILRQG